MTTFLLDIDPRGVATLTLNRPEVANAYDEALLRAMTDGDAAACRPTRRCARW